MQESLFNEYNMEGVSPEHNQIFVEFSPDTLHKVGVKSLLGRFYNLQTTTWCH